MRSDTDNYVLNLNSEYVEYYLSDINKNLQEKDVKILLRWEVMSTVGFYYSDMIEITSFKLPKNFSSKAKR